MFISNVNKKEEIRNIVIKHLRKHGIKYRIKNRQLVQQQTGPKQKRKFNVPLDQLESTTVTLENGEQILVPKIIYDMTEFILKGVKTEGIFRKEGFNKRIMEIKLFLEKGGTLSSEMKVIEVAVLLKRFLRSLPQLLIPISFHDLFLSCIIPQNKKFLVPLACLLLPTEHLNVLAYLMMFLQQISRHKDQNKMDEYNLSVCLWPCIIPVDEKVVSKIAVNRLCELVQLLIENAGSIGIIPDYIIEEIGQEEIHRKRRSGSLTRMFSGLRKIVSNGKGVGESDHHSECNIVTPDLLITPSIDRSKSKKRRLNNVELSPKKNNKDKKSQWYQRSSVKNLKEEINDEHKQKRRNSMGPKTLLERKWSQVSQVANFRKIKRNSLQPNILNEINQIVIEKLPKEPDYVRVSKVEYEDIKNRVSKIEKRISLELEQANFQQRNIKKKDNKKFKAVENVEKVITAYEHTLEQNEPMSPTTDHLARRLSKELKIRRNSEEKNIRSPSARKIGSLRRKSREIERRQIKRHQSWHVSNHSNLKLHFSEFFDKTPVQQNTINRPVSRSTSFNLQARTNFKNSSFNLENSTHWINAHGFFADTPISHNKNNPDNGRASIAKLRTQNAGMVLAKTKLFDNIQDSNSSFYNKSENKETTPSQSNKNEFTLSSEFRRVRVLKLEEKKVKKTSPRRKNTNKQTPQIAKKEDKIVLTPVNHTRYLNSPKSTFRGVPHIKKNLNVRSPKRLCRTPISLDRRTPLKVLVSRINN